MGSSLSAQNANPVSGGNARGPNGSVSYSVGQTAIGSYENANGSLNAGVQQPYTAKVIAGADVTEVTLEITVYPNPTSSTVTLRIDEGAIESYSMELFDVTGKLVHAQSVTASQTQIPMTQRAAGTYVLRVLRAGAQIKSFNIIKKD